MLLDFYRYNFLQTRPATEPTARTSGPWFRGVGRGRTEVEPAVDFACMPAITCAATRAPAAVPGRQGGTMRLFVAAVAAFALVLAGCGAGAAPHPRAAPPPCQARPMEDLVPARD